MKMRLGMAALPLCAVLISGCTSPNNTDLLKEQTANATAAAKRDAGAIAKGIVEGLERKGPLDINTCSGKQLQTLPGITPGLAQSIIAGRPYSEASQLYRKHILTKPQYNRIRPQVIAQP